MSFYDILGVNHDASAGDIKRAYKQRALDVHPDKINQKKHCHSMSNNDVSMTELNEAYNVLRDPQKRSYYDMMYHPGGDQHINMQMVFMCINILMCTIIDILASLKNQIHEAPASSSHETSEYRPDAKYDYSNNKALIVLKISVTLEDLYQKHIKRIVYKRCMLNGVMEKRKLYLSLCNHQDIYMFKRQGDEVAPDTFGDVQVDLVVVPHPTFVLDTLIDRHDLWMEVDMTVYEYYYGKSHKFYHLDGTETDVVTSGFKSQSNMVVIMHGLGLPYFDDEYEKESSGDLYVSFRLVMHAIDKDVLESEEVKATFQKWLS